MVISGTWIEGDRVKVISKIWTKGNRVKAIRLRQKVIKPR